MADAVSQKYIIGMRLLLLGIEHALNQANGNGGGSDAKLADMVDEIRPSEFPSWVASGRCQRRYGRANSAHQAHQRHFGPLPKYRQYSRPIVRDR